MSYSNVPFDIQAALVRVQDVFDGVGASDRPIVTEFACYVGLFSQRHPKSMQLTEDCFYKLVTTLCADLSSLRNEALKDGSVLCALWVIFLRMYAEMFPDRVLDQNKYKTMDQFKTEYASSFPRAGPEEMEQLWKIANWMCILFPMTPAKRNKCFYLQVVPKLVEGYEVKYVLGTGQSYRTSYRAEVFERESGIPRRKRKKTRAISPSVTELAAVQSLFSGETALSPVRKISKTQSDYSFIEGCEEQKHEQPHVDYSTDDIFGLKAVKDLIDPQPLGRRRSVDEFINSLSMCFHDNSVPLFEDCLVIDDNDTRLESNNPDSTMAAFDILT